MTSLSMALAGLGITIEGARVVVSATARQPTLPLSPQASR